MKAWESFIQAQENEIGSETVNKWLKTLKVLRFDACNLYLEAKDAFQLMWFEEHIRQKVVKTLFNANQRKIKVHLSVANLPPKAKGRALKPSKEAAVKQNAFTLTFDELDPNCTFKNFVVSQKNVLTHKVFSQLIDIEPVSNQLNPVYVYGPTGCGKTHLLMAVADTLRQQGKHVVFSRAQTFADHVVSAIRAGEMSTFRQAYRNSDALIIDDVHVFSRKGATQEEFFHTFNSLQGAGKQIILAANCSPGELQLIEPRLVSRFEWGIVLSLEASTREDAEKIISMKSKSMDFPLHPKLIEFLLETFVSTKSLNQALEALILRSHLNPSSGKQSSTNLTVLQAKHLLSDLILEEERSALTPQRIVQYLAEFFGIRIEDIFGKAQTRDCVLPRQIAMHLCRSLLKMPYVKIGDLFGRDHSTVMSSVKLIQKGIDADDDEIAAPFRAITRKIKG